ncbi:hypothetical protein [Shimia ponticola]|uniref:hypothetical protein n=1 Tax=Shimia ponticola TaxID=2582893 RepID=UPI0011BFB3DF|nr:hypothetical protein [Shimia ponticola]
MTHPTLTPDNPAILSSMRLELADILTHAPADQLTAMAEAAAIDNGGHCIPAIAGHFAQFHVLGICREADSLSTAIQEWCKSARRTARAMAEDCRAHA